MTHKLTSREDFSKIIIVLNTLYKTILYLGFLLQSKEDTFAQRLELSNLSDQVWEGIFNELPIKGSWPRFDSDDMKRKVSEVADTVVGGHELLAAATRPDVHMIEAIQEIQEKEVVSNYRQQSREHREKFTAAAAEMKKLREEKRGNRLDPIESKLLAKGVAATYNIEKRSFSVIELKIRALVYFGADVLDAKIAAMEVPLI